MSSAPIAVIGAVVEMRECVCVSVVCVQCMLVACEPCVVLRETRALYDVVQVRLLLYCIARYSARHVQTALYLAVMISRVYAQRAD